MRVIESITIRYFRSVYTVTLNGCKDINVITGKNDVGKSNILKALNLFFCQQSDFMQSFSFDDDYSLTRREIVKRNSIRGQRYFSISIRFNRGDRMKRSLPPTFTVTKRWDMHSQECKTNSDVHRRMQLYATTNDILYSEKTTSRFLSMFLNKIKYVYIPAIKDEKVFTNTLNILQSNIYKSDNSIMLDEPIRHANEAIQEIIGELQDDFKSSTGIDNLVQLPNSLNYTSGLLQIDTTITNGIVPIDKRGDGIRTHYIPKILNYVANNSDDIYVWGFEEPENSYEYRRCIQVAKEFEKQYANTSQIFLTSHSPAFFEEIPEKKAIFRMGRDGDKTILLKDDIALDEELGYIELYRKFAERIVSLQEEINQQKCEIEGLQNEIRDSQTPIILTEGKTDASFLKLAIEKLNLHDYENWEIKQITSGNTHNNDVLLRFLHDLRDNRCPDNLVIGLFDRDSKLEITIDGRKKDIRDYEYVKISANIYAFAIPVPHNRPQTDQISIEHFFTDSEIKTELNGKRLFLGNEFYPTGIYKGDEELYYRASAELFDTIKIIEHETNKYVTNAEGTGDYSISKTVFVESIANGIEGFTDISFSEFQKIFDLIGRIVQNNNT